MVKKVSRSREDGEGRWLEEAEEKNQDRRIRTEGLFAQECVREQGVGGGRV